MRKRDSFGTKLLAFVTLVPAFIALTFFLEGDGWYWLPVAIAYPPLSFGLAMLLFGGDTNGKDGEQQDL
ncbi:hypothetical protein GCM10027517_12180 [Phycicoccus ginsengisoli]